MRALSARELADLRQTVRTQTCPSCGAPIDLAREPACPYCRAPIAVLDPAQVEAVVEEVKRGGAPAGGDPEDAPRRS